MKKSMFQEKVEALGFKNYDDYLSSEVWASKKKEYSNSGRARFCQNCQKPKYILHHLTYENLGHETLDDFTALCSGCHQALHQMIKAGARWPSTTSAVIKMLRREVKHKTSVHTNVPTVASEKVSAILKTLSVLDLRELQVVNQWMQQFIASVKHGKITRRREVKLKKTEDKLLRRLNVASKRYPKDIVQPASAIMSASDMAEHIRKNEHGHGGFSKKFLASVGVPWPPPKGWRQRLTTQSPEGEK